MFKNIICLIIGFMICFAIFHKQIIKSLESNNKNITFNEVLLKSYNPSEMYANVKLSKQADLNKDGKTDAWVYSYKNENIITHLDKNHDGKIDIWLYLKNNLAYLENNDFDNDGKIDNIVLNIEDLNKKTKFISLKLKDNKINLFEVDVESGWLPVSEKGGISVSVPKQN